MVMHIKSSRKRVYNSAEDRMIRMVDTVRKYRGRMLAYELDKAVKAIASTLISYNSDHAWIDDDDINPTPIEARQFAYWHGYLCTRYGLGYTTARYKLVKAMSDERWSCYLAEEQIHSGEEITTGQLDNLIRNIVEITKDPRNSVFG